MSNDLCNISPLFRIHYRKYYSSKKGINYPVVLTNVEMEQYLFYFFCNLNSKSLLFYKDKVMNQIREAKYFKIPITKDLQEWSDYYWFISPNNFCKKCRIFTITDIFCRNCNRDIIITSLLSVELGVFKSKFYHLNWLPVIRTKFAISSTTFDDYCYDYKFILRRIILELPKFCILHIKFTNTQLINLKISRYLIKSFYSIEDIPKEETREIYFP